MTTIGEPGAARAGTPRRRPRVVVCGTRFGQVHLAALSSPTAPGQLAGILAQGSERSRRSAERYGVDLYTRVDDLPGDVDVACVVVGGAMTGGPGTDLALALLERGVHVLQEHPVHHDELKACLRAAGRRGVVYSLNTLYPHVAPVRRFVEAVHRLRRQSPVTYVDGAGALQVKHALFEIMCRALGGVRPAGLVAVDGPPEPEGRDRPFRSLAGEIAGVPATVRIQNQVCPRDPDNHAHLYHRITVGTEAGSLTLVDTHGPVVWTPRPHIPREVQAGVDPASSTVASLDLPTATVVGSVATPKWREAMTGVWPEAVERALVELGQEIAIGRSTSAAQRHLALSALVQEVNERLGPPQILDRPSPTPQGAAALLGDDER